MEDQKSVLLSYIEDASLTSVQHKYSSKKSKSKRMDIGVVDGDFVYGINEYYSTIKLVTELSLYKKFLTEWHFREYKM
jgi:hypothetical protein